MATNRTPIARAKRQNAISPEIVAIFRRARDLGDADGVDLWEEEGGHQRQWLDACHALHVALKRKPWQEDVTNCIGCGDRPPEWMRDAGRIADWLEAREILTALEEAAK